MAHASNVFKITPEATPYLISAVKAKARKLWIVLPAFNEAENLGKLIENIFASLHESIRNYEVVVVDDGSQDSTKRVAEGFLSQVPMTVLVHEKNLGLGATMRDGFQYVVSRVSVSHQA